MVDLFNAVPTSFVSTPIECRKYPTDFLNHLIQGSCLDVMPYLPEAVLDLVITSPPYFVKKNYEIHWTYNEYCTLLKSLFQLVYDKLKPGGYFVVNFGDYFNSNNRFYEAEVPSVYPACVNYFTWGREAGFDLQATRIWRKQFARMSIPFVCNNHPRPIFDYEHIWTFRKRDGIGVEFVNNRKLSQKGVLGEGWRAPADLPSHEASFPIDLPLWAISVYSKEEGDIVLDPFCGSGTTALACLETKRKFIGIELSEEYCSKAFLKLRSYLPIEKLGDSLRHTTEINFCDSA